MKKWWGGGALIIALCGGTFGLMFLAGQTLPQPAQVDGVKDQSAITTPISLVFAGDVMLDRGVKRSVDYNFAGNYDELFINTPYFKAADIAFLNLEGPVAESGKNVGSKYSFRMQPTVLGTLSRAGIDMVSFANNHVGDYTLAAFTETLSLLDKNKIGYTGAGYSLIETTTPKIIEVRGVKIGFLGASDVGPDWIAASDTSAGILLASNPQLPKIITAAKAQVDVLVVSFHWGEEYKEANERQTSLAHTSIDAGADIIVGHHPHVAQRVESYKGKPIFYSLGNFIFDQYFSPETMQGLVATVWIDEQKNIRHKTDVVMLDKRYQPQAIIESVDILPLALAHPISEKVCPAPEKSGVDLSFIAIPTEYSLVGHVPEDLVSVGTKSTGEVLCAKKEAYAAFLKMQNALKQKALGLSITTAYRATDDQNEIRTSFLSRGLAALVADVGSSEHQLGTAFDFGSTSTSGTFGASPEYAWLQKNAAGYGFVQSYTASSERENGYPSEPWHWRYVGSDMAAKIKSSGKAVNTYLKTLQ